MPRFNVELTRNRWPSILAGLGVDEKTLSKRNCPCPFCGGKDRFRFTDFEGLGMWTCNVCGPGNGMQFVQKWSNVDFVGAIHLVEAQLPSATEAAQPKRQPPRHRLNTLWSGASPISDNDPVGEYLLARDVWTDDPLTELRFAENVAYFDEGTVVGKYDAMLARVRDGDGKPTTLHCTYLDGARKAEVRAPKKVLSAMGEGAAIRLFKPTHQLALAEGIETALAVHNHTGLPTWATISAGGMRSIEIPKGVTEVFIYADNDEGYTGQAAAYHLAQRLHAAGLGTAVCVPRSVDMDWADYGAWTR